MLTDDLFLAAPVLELALRFALDVVFDLFDPEALSAVAICPERSDVTSHLSRHAWPTL
jgi:S-adenosylmethionine/arginine decarboxylase-like enzyme